MLCTAFTPCDLFAAQMIAKANVIRELKLYEIELSHDGVETTQNICCAKSTVTRWLKKFRRSICKKYGKIFNSHIYTNSFLKFQYELSKKTVASFLNILHLVNRCKFTNMCTRDIDRILIMWVWVHDNLIYDSGDEDEKNGWLVGWLVVWLLFYGISTLGGYLMQNPLYIYIYIYIICKWIVWR